MIDLSEVKATRRMLEETSLSLVDRQVKLQHMGWTFKDRRNSKGRVLTTTIIHPSGMTIKVSNDGDIEVIKLYDQLNAVYQHLNWIEETSK